MFLGGEGTHPRKGEVGGKLERKRDKLKLKQERGVVCVNPTKPMIPACVL